MRGDGLLFAPILAVVLLGGSARLALFSLQAITVRVADIYASQAVVAAFNPQLPPATMFLLVSGKATQADHAFIQSRKCPSSEVLMDDTTALVEFVRTNDCADLDLVVFIEVITPALLR